MHGVDTVSQHASTPWRACVCVCWSQRTCVCSLLTGTFDVGNSLFCLPSCTMLSPGCGMWDLHNLAKSTPQTPTRQMKVPVALAHRCRCHSATTRSKRNVLDVSHLPVPVTYLLIAGGRKRCKRNHNSSFRPAPFDEEKRKG